MPMSSDAPEPSPHAAQNLWLVLTASQLGAAHQASGLPNQDAVAAQQIRPDVLVAAAADGHGHRRHFRSARGSRFAVTIACEAARDLGARLDEFEAAGPIESEALRGLVPAITGRWREAVRADVAAYPFTSVEETWRASRDDALIAYGSTLLLAIAGRRWLVLIQIGDGDIMGIQPDGRPLLPVPGDPSLDGQQTTSLCGVRAEDDFRAAVVDTVATPLLGVMLSTDGYGNAQIADPWTDAVSADLAELINDRPPEWLAGQLPLWAGRCASTDGSADDTTIALLIAPLATGWRHAVAEEPEGDEEAIAAARRLAEPTTQPGHQMEIAREQRLAKSALFGAAGTRTIRDAPRPAAPASAAPAPAGWAPATGRASAARSRRLMVIAAVAVVIAAAAAFLAINLSSSSGPRPTSCASPASAGRTASSAASAVSAGRSASAGRPASAGKSATPAAEAQAGATSNPCRATSAGDLRKPRPAGQDGLDGAGHRNADPEAERTARLRVD
jgi:Protein phosphatase 2C